MLDRCQQILPVPAVAVDDSGGVDRAVSIAYYVRPSATTSHNVGEATFGYENQELGRFCEW